MTTVATPNSQRRNIQVYFLAASEDQSVCEDIIKHLKPIARSSPIPIEVNSDFNIPGGADREKHKQQLFEADIVLALISVDFIDNDEIYSRNQRVIERYNNHETVMIPILVRNFMWKATPFSSLPVVPKNLQPLNNKQFWNSQDDALMAVVSDIYNSINELAQAQNVAVKMESAPAIEAPATTSISQPKSESSMAESVRTQSEVMQQPSPVAKVENAPDPMPASKTLASQATSRARVSLPKVSLPIAADWRKKYYITVMIKRAGAIILDQLLIIYVPLILLIALGISDSALDFIIVGIYFVVMPIMESSKWQGTLGKRILKLQITDREGERITFLRAFWRNIVRSLVLYGYIVSFGVLLVIQYFRFNQTRKLFHDELSGTVIGERLVSSSAIEVAGNAA